MPTLTESNLITLNTELKQGQRCIRIGSSILPVGVGGIGGDWISSLDNPATASDVLMSKQFYASGSQAITGTIPTVSAQISGGSVIVPSGYIASPQSFVQGTDVSSTTAEASDVLSGKIFYTSGGVQTSGTIPTVSATIQNGSITVPSGFISSAQSFPMPNFSEVTATAAMVAPGALFYDSTGELAEGNMPFVLGGEITPTTSSQTISGGVYLSDDITVFGDAALVGSNIASGVSIFGVSGTFQGWATYSSATITANQVLSGGVFYDSAGNVSSGAIQIIPSRTITPTTSAQYISAGVYTGGTQTILGDAALVASNIVSGVSIFGVSGNVDVGTDVSDTTATAADVLSGKVFYTSGGVQTSGTISTVTASLSGNVATVPAGYIASQQTLTVPEAEAVTVNGNEVSIPVGYIASVRAVTVGTTKTAQTYTPTTSDQTIASGHYLTGNQTIKGDANLLSENIVSGVTIFGVTGTASSGGGTDGAYLCTSASDPVQYRLYGDTYGGTYVYDGQLSGKDVYTNGTYYVMWNPNYMYSGVPGSSNWNFYSDRDFNTRLDIGTFNLLDAFVTSGGQTLAWQPETVSSGTWTGREMVANSVGYYEPVTSDSATSGLTYTNIVPRSGEMYTADALKHIDQIWNYDYKRDIKAFISSTANELNPGGEDYFEGFSGPDENGWFTVSEGSGTFNGYNWETGGSFWTANGNAMTLHFKFKPLAWSSQYKNYNWIINNGLVGMYIMPDGRLGIESYENYLRGGKADGDAHVFDFTFTANQEYDITVLLDNSSCRVIINGVLVAYLIPDRNPPADISTVTVHEGVDYQWDGCTYAYKEISMWGRAMTELAAYSSAAPLSNVTVSGYNAQMRIAGDLPVNGLTVASGGKAYVYGGGQVSGCTVNSGGTLIVLSAGTALNVTSETGAGVSVGSGGSITYA